MNLRTGTGWQTLLADLSIILFMVTAAALSRSSDGPASKVAAPVAAPVALYRAGAGAPRLSQWLTGQAADSRQRLSIVVPYRAGGQAEAVERAGALLREAGALGANARIVIEPGEDEATVSLAFDAALAQSLPERRDNQESVP